MKASQKNRQTRDLNVKSCIEKPDIAPVLDEIPEYPALKTRLDDDIIKLETLQLKQFTILRGLNAARTSWRRKTILACLQLSSRLVALGTQTEDEALLAAARVTMTSLTRLRHLDLVAKSQGLVDLGIIHLPELLIYRITPEIMTEMANTCSSFREAVVAAEAGRVAQKQVTNDILQTLKSIDVILDRIALLVETLKEEEPLFYELFRMAFRVVHTGGSVLSASGYVVDGDTREGIHKCQIKITHYQPLQEPAIEGGLIKGGITPKVLNAYTDMPVKLTSPNGGFRFKNLADGTYELAAFRSGYNEERVLFYVNNGECAEVIIRMRKLGTEAA